MKNAGVQEVTLNLAIRVGSLISGIGIQSLLAYALLPAGRGAFAVCVLYASILGIVLTVGVDAAAQHYVMKGSMTLAQAVSVALAIALAASVISVLVSIPLISSDIPFFAKADRRSFFLALAIVPLNSFAAAVQNQLAGFRKFGHIAIFSMCRSLTNALCVVALVYMVPLSVDGAILAVCLSSVMMIVLSIRHLSVHFGLTWELPKKGTLIEVLVFGLRFFVARIGWGVDFRIGTLIVATLAASDDVGFFSTASGLMMQFVMISNAIFNPVLPRAAKSATGRPELVSFCARCAMWVTGCTIGVFLAISEPVVRVILSAAFLPVIPLVFILAPGVLVFSSANLLTAYFRSVDRPGVCSWAVGCGLVANVATVVALFSAMGVAAAALGMTVGLVVRSVILGLVYVSVAKCAMGTIIFPQAGDWRRILDVVRSMQTIVGRGRSVGT